jgi:GNAT superfamily N-acetyltransferase
MDMKFVLSPAVVQDVESLADLIGQLAAHHGEAAQCSADHLRDFGFSGAPWVQFLVAEQGAELIGYACLTRRVQVSFARRIVDLHHLFIKQEHRGAGVGRALVAAARQGAQEAGAAVLTVGAQPGNPRAQGFYRDLGFRVARQGAVQFFLPLDLSAAGLAG